MDLHQFWESITYLLLGLIQRITFANNEEYYKYKRNPKKYLKTASKENYTITKY